MSKYQEFMKTTLTNKIKKCKIIYSFMPQDHGTIILINEILIDLEKIHNSEDSLKDKVDFLNKLRKEINPKNIFKNRLKLDYNLKFCDQVMYAIAWAQDYYKGLLNKENLLLLDNK
tara:strand:+ start:188 stop:535 length:348 start_codon:yes stop_codon:yes gene_type:complete